MGAVHTPLVDRAKSIFDDLGYHVTGDGDELRAERKWRVVHVTTADPADAPETGNFRCFVAESDRAEGVRAKLKAEQPNYDWAVIAVDDGDYEVLHPEPDVLPAP